jgi:hypothetical protein
VVSASACEGRQEEGGRVERAGGRCQLVAASATQVPRFRQARDEPMSTSGWAVRSHVAVKDGQLLTKPPAAARTTSERPAGVTDHW